MVGIIQEQHPDRCRLFMQWKEMDWPIMVDSLNLLGVAAVPITLFIDEHGIVRNARPRQSDLEAFVQAEYEAPADVKAFRPAAPDLESLAADAATGDTRALMRYADAVVMFGSADRLDQAIDAYQSLLAQDPEDGAAHFRLGVAHRKRYETDTERQPDDFAHAIEHWTTALGINPNQYIWRRRIQQWGPRLDKPYSFYDWVVTARTDIRERGDEPVELTVEPSGAEFAQRAREFVSTTEVEEGEPAQAIALDDTPLIIAESVVVPTTARGAVYRVYVLFRPNAAVSGHWNNEAEPMMVRVKPPDGWEVDRRLFTVENAPAATSLETRSIEFELRYAGEGNAASTKLTLHARYNACEGASGVCVYRQLDVAVPIRSR